MSTSIVAKSHCKTVSEVRNVSIDFSGKLDAGELLSGAVALDDGGLPGAVTVEAGQINSVELTIQGRKVAAGKAVQFKVSGGTIDQTDTVKISVGTDAVPAQALVANVKIKVIKDNA